VTGGQNTAISILLVVLLWRSLHEGRDVRAGMAVGLLLFKPPLALPFLGALVLARRWRGVGGALATAVALDLLGAAATDLSWPAAWADAVGFLDLADTPFNLENFVSFPGVAEAVLGLDSTAAQVVGVVTAVAVGSVAGVAWFREQGDLAPRIALTTAAALAMSPHALYYDAGLLALVAVVAVDRRPSSLPWLGVAWSVGFTHLASGSLGFSPIVLLVVAALVFTISELMPDRRTVAPVAQAPRS